MADALLVRVSMAFEAFERHLAVCEPCRRAWNAARLGHLCQFGRELWERWECSS